MQRRSWSWLICAVLLVNCGTAVSLPPGPPPPLDVAAPTRTLTATFALGCFWHVESQFGCLPGVVRTRVGYTGGQTPNPTYHEIGDHTEVVQLDYDPTQTSYARLLDVFWATHNPCGRSWTRQYRTAAFYHDEEQHQAALESKAREERRQGRPVQTALLPLQVFYLAEDEHQKYLLRQTPSLLHEIQLAYPQPADLTSSTAAARLNSYLGGQGSRTMLEKEIDGLGLSATGKKLLRETWQRRQE